MKKKLAIVAGVIVALLAVAGLVMWRRLAKPLYEPGMAARLALDAPPASGEAGFWTVEPGIRLHWFAEGSGPAVMVVHGGPGFPFPEPLAALKPLAARYRFIYYDQRGSGKSTHPIDRFESRNYFENIKRLNSALGLAAQIADIERIRRILREDKIVLLGHSFGGFLASLYAAEFPAHVKAMVLAAPAGVLVMPSPEGNVMEQIAKLLPPERRGEYAAFLRRYFDFTGMFRRSEADHRAMNAEFMKYYGLAVASRGMRARAPAGVDNGGWIAPAIYFGMGRRHDYRRALSAVQAPVLVLHGANDLQPQSVSQVYASAFPHGRLAVVPNAGHFLFDDQPQTFGAEVKRFLEQVR